MAWSLQGLIDCQQEERLNAVTDSIYQWTSFWEAYEAGVRQFAEDRGGSLRRILRQSQDPGGAVNHGRFFRDFDNGEGYTSAVRLIRKEAERRSCCGRTSPETGDVISALTVCFIYASYSSHPSMGRQQVFWFISQHHGAMGQSRDAGTVCRLAKENTPDRMSGEPLEPIEELIFRNWAGWQGERSSGRMRQSDAGKDSHSKILSNTVRDCTERSCVLYPGECWKQFAGTVSAGDLYVLPSSVHEVLLLIPDHG